VAQHVDAALAGDPLLEERPLRSVAGDHEVKVRMVEPRKGVHQVGVTFPAAQGRDDAEDEGVLGESERFSTGS
jgi:hypothetical protein